MKYKVFVFNPVQENTYLAWDEASGEAAIIDSGMWMESECKQIEAFLADGRLRLKYALQTHTHFDHIFGLGFIHERYGVQPMCHADDADVYKQQPALTQQFGLRLAEPLPAMARLLNDGDQLQLGHTALRVIHTPGHTPGCCCYHCEEAALLFAGDTLFRAGIGRTDLPGGDFDAEIESIRQRLFSLPEDTVVLPGHGPSSAIGWEKRNNPYVTSAD